MSKRKTATVATGNGKSGCASVNGSAAVRKQLATRLDYCRDQVCEIAVHHNFAKEEWAELAETLEKAVRELRLCIVDASYLECAKRQNDRTELSARVRQSPPLATTAKLWRSKSASC